jgi:hypothetical protein
MKVRGKRNRTMNEKTGENGGKHSQKGCVRSKYLLTEKRHKYTSPPSWR